MIPAFILLTETDKDEKILVNANQIRYVEKEEDDDYSTVYLLQDSDSSSDFTVTETPEKVYELIQEQLRSK